MWRKYVLLFGLISLLLVAAACSNEEENIPLEVEADEVQENVLTEADILYDISKRFDDIYVPMDQGELERFSLTYNVDNEDLMFEYDYDLIEASKENHTLPSKIRLKINAMTDDMQAQVKKKMDNFEEEKDLIVIKKEQGDGWLFFDRYDTFYYEKTAPYEDEIFYILENVSKEEVPEVFHFVSQEQKEQEKDIYANFVRYFDFESRIFLDLKHTNFAIASMGISERDNQQTVSVTYAYEGYEFKLVISELKDEEEVEESMTQWVEDGYVYRLEASSNDKEANISDEAYEQFRAYMTRNINDID